METPWEHELERALSSQLASVRVVDGDETNDGGGENVRDADARRDDRAAQLDELTALASIFGDDLGGPAAAYAKRAARALGIRQPRLGLLKSRGERGVGALQLPDPLRHALDILQRDRQGQSRGFALHLQTIR